MVIFTHRAHGEANGFEANGFGRNTMPVIDRRSQRNGWGWREGRMVRPRTNFIPSALGASTKERVISTCIKLS